jgi:hypothetical protein
MQSGAAFIDSREGSRQLRIGVLAAAMTLLVLAWSPSQAQPRASQTLALGALLPAMPDAGSLVTLRAVNDPRTGLAAFLLRRSRDRARIARSPGRHSSGRLRECNVNSLHGDLHGWALH